MAAQTLTIGKALNEGLRKAMEADSGIRIGELRVHLRPGKVGFSIGQDFAPAESVRIR